MATTNMMFLFALKAALVGMVTGLSTFFLLVFTRLFFGVLSPGLQPASMAAMTDATTPLTRAGGLGMLAAAMGLGVALNVGNPVVVLDGDGAALMKMGTLATIGAYGPQNLIHIVTILRLNNIHHRLIRHTRGKEYNLHTKAMMCFFRHCLCNTAIADQPQCLSGYFTAQHMRRPPTLPFSGTHLTLTLPRSSSNY